MLRHWSKVRHGKAGLSRLGFLLAGWILIFSNVPADDMNLEWGKIEDPRIREALFDLYSQDYFSGIVRMLSNRNYIEQGQEKTVADLLLATLYLAYGMPDNSRNIMLDAADLGISSELQNRIWYYLAKYFFQNGQLNKTHSALAQIRRSISAPVKNDYLLLYADVLANENSNKKAIEILSKIDGKDQTSMFAGFNKAILQIRTGKTDAGLGALEKLTRIESTDTDIISLQEQARLSLASYFLQNNEPDRAKKELVEIRLESPLAPRALLGMGWAYSAMNKQKSALVAWSELAKHGVTNDAVVEGYLASGYAYGQLKALSQALAQFEKSSVIIKTEIRRVKSLIKTVKEDDLVKLILEAEPLTENGWFGDMKTLPQIPAQKYLLSLFATHSYQEAYKNYRDLKYLSNQLTDWMDKLEKHSGMSVTFRESYMNRVIKQQTRTAKMLDQTHQHMAQVMTDYLIARLITLQSYLKRARFQMAQILDQAGNLPIEQLAD